MNLEVRVNILKILKEGVDGVTERRIMEQDQKKMTKIK